MAEFIEEAPGLESTTIGIYRTAATVKGGRRFSFGALVAVGDRNGGVGLGYGKAPGVPAAIEKAQKAARKNIQKLTLQGGTIPHQSTGRFGAAEIRLVPASPGTGVIAGGTARAVLELAGVKDILTKSHGSTNQKNLAKAVLDGLLNVRSKKTIEELRGVKIEKTHVDEILEAGQRFAPVARPEPAAPAKQEDDRKGKGKGKGKGRGKGKDKPEAATPAEASAEATVAAETPSESASAPEAPPETPEAPATDKPESNENPS